MTQECLFKIGSLDRIYSVLLMISQLKDISLTH